MFSGPSRDQFMYEYMPSDDEQWNAKHIWESEVPHFVDELPQSPASPLQPLASPLPYSPASPSLLPAGDDDNNGYDYNMVTMATEKPPPEEGSGQL